MISRKAFHYKIASNFIWFLILIYPVKETEAQTKQERLDSLFTAEYQQRGFNGNVLVAEKGVVLYKNSFGMAIEESSTLLNDNTIFELASVTKQFTAMGILILKKKDKLALSDRLSHFFPELGFYYGITIDQMIHHTSGLPDYIDLFKEKWDKTKFATNKDIIAGLARYKPDARFEAGFKFEYSNTGYALLASIIEKVSGQTYGDFLAEQIFIPLKMNNTFVYRRRYEKRQLPNYAHGYFVNSDGQKISPDSFGKKHYIYFLDGIVGDGMVNSTLDDLFKWDRALNTNQLVDEEDKSLIFSSSTTTSGTSNHYGYGWALELNNEYGKIASHSGGWAGNTTYIERHLDSDKTVILLLNNYGKNISFPLIQIREILYEVSR